MARQLFVVLSLVCISLNGFAQQKGYYRTPAIHDNTVVFTAEGDLWKYDLASGQSLRLTTHAGVESHPVISPDGKQIVFSGQYEGPTELYLINIDGGVPKRLTYDFDNGIIASGWSGNETVLYATSRYSQLPSARLFRLDIHTGRRTPLPLAEASWGSVDETGVLFFNRFAKQPSNTKRYKGGDIQQIWVFDGHAEAKNLTGDFDGTSAYPIVAGDRVFFLSDRDGTMNLWSITKDGQDPKQHTFSKGWDLNSPSVSGSHLVYQKGADLWLYDIAAGTEKMLDIRLQSDFEQRKTRWIKNPAGSISFSDISPNGKYTAIISRGRVFVAPAEGERWVEVNRKSGIRYRQVHFINNRKLALLSDQSGESEIWEVSADGSDSGRQITHDSKPMISGFTVSPDEKWVAFTDKNDVFRIADMKTGDIKFRYDSAYAGLGDLSWSPGGKYVLFSRGLANLNTQICVVETKTMRMTPLTTTRLNSYTPAWSSDSNWLFFASERDLNTRVNSPWGSRQPEPYYTETGKMYAMPLDTGLRFPFLAKDAWLMDSSFNPALRKKPQPGGTGKKTAPKPEKTVNWNYTKNNLYEVPLDGANLSGMDIAGGYLYWIDQGEGKETRPKLFSLKIENSKKYEPVEVAAGVNGFNLSADRKKILISLSGNTFLVADANGQKADPVKSKLSLENWSFEVDPVEDWKELFADAWRMMRDYFYDRDLHKVDWPAMRQKYEPLLTRVTDRYELDDVLAQMVGEISALHTFVVGGDKRMSPDQIPVGFLGARMTRQTKGWQIDHIIESDRDYPAFTSPLDKPELGIRNGDIITAINNVSVLSVPDLAVLLTNKVHAPVKLTLTHPGGTAFEESVTPCSAAEDYQLRYNEWELQRREKTDSLTGEQIGYVHLKAMGSADMDNFTKQFYPVFDRKGLVIDMRHNFGGNIDSWVLEKLMRKAWMYFQGRSGGPTWNMQYAFRGPMVILCDQVTASDGEAVTEGFRRLGLGKVIGMRTWGGEIWLSMDNRLVDNGIASAAESGVYGPEGKWLIEGRGVEPDIKVDNLPFETYQGKDAQLEAAIKLLQEQIKQTPMPVPAAPAFPDKSFNSK